MLQVGLESELAIEDNAQVLGFLRGLDGGARYCYIGFCAFSVIAGEVHEDVLGLFELSTVLSSPSFCFLQRFLQPSSVCYVRSLRCRIQCH